VGSNPNYDVTKHDGTLTIGKASASVTANDKSKTYGQANPAFDAAVTGTVNNDVLATRWRQQRIRRRRRQLPIVVTWAATELRGHEARWHADDRQGVGVGHGQRQEQDLRPGEPGVRRGCDGTVNGDRWPTAGDGRGPDQRRRQLPIVVTLGSNPNYDVTKTDGTLTIGKASASVTANDKSKTTARRTRRSMRRDWHGQRRRTGLHAGDGSGSDHRRRQLPDRGDARATPNYDVTQTDGSLTIGKAPASVKANDKTRTYGDANPALDAVVTAR
jgi:hypothetical protein